jgi:hypothetical protein
MVGVEEVSLTELRRRASAKWRTYPVGCGNSDMLCELQVRTSDHLDAVMLLPTTVMYW